MLESTGFDLMQINPQSLTWLGSAFGVGVLCGIGFCFLWLRRTMNRQRAEIDALQALLKTQAEIEKERLAAMNFAEQHLAASFAELANKSLAQNSDSFLRLARESLGKHQERARSELTEREKAIAELVKPIQQALEKTQRQIGEIEKHRHETFGSIRAQLETMAAGQAALQTETRNLVTALRRPEVRGQWGELTLRRIVELAGMVEHCDFVEQAHVETDEGAIRPDMIVRLPDHGEIVIDVKTPLDAYLQAAETTDDNERRDALIRHARNVAERVRELASKAYWTQFESSPEFVILFIPGDQFLTAALSERPTLLDDALREKVILATPTSLVALLKAVAYGWRQLALAENAEEIKRLAQELHARLGTFTGHLARLGKQLEGSVKAYNRAVGSLERLVLPGARKFVELGVHEKRSIEALPPLESLPRQVDETSSDDSGPAPETDESTTQEPAADEPVSIEPAHDEISDKKNGDTPATH